MILPSNCRGERGLLLKTQRLALAHHAKPKGGGIIPPRFDPPTQSAGSGMGCGARKALIIWLRSAVT